MDNWSFKLVFILAILIIVRHIYLFLIQLFSQSPTKYKLEKIELFTLGIAISYFITYLIY